MTQLVVEQSPPVCPHRESEITELDATLLRPADDAPFGFGKRYLYACSSCRTVLGVSHRKGFWMG